MLESIFIGAIIELSKIDDINMTQNPIVLEQSLTLTQKLVSFAKSNIGKPYGTAKAGPDSFDCSGFVFFVFKSFDMYIPRSSRLQSKSGVKIDREHIKIGDILFFDTANRGHINHSGIYLGDGNFIHSSSGKAYSVTISNLDKGFYLDKFRWGVDKINSK